MSTTPSPIDAVGPEQRAERLTAIGLMCLALICFATLDATVKYLSASIPVLQIIFCRFATHFTLTVALTPRREVPTIWRSKRWAMQILRGLLMLATTTFNFIAVSYLQLAETMAIFFATPFVVALLAGPLLGERIGPRRFAAVLVGFLGVLVVLRPGLDGLPWQAVYSVMAMLTYAGYAITTRILAPTQTAATTQFYAAGIGTIAYLPFIYAVWQTPQTWFLAFLLVLIGFIGGLGHQFMILAHRRAPAPILAPFIYTQIIWMVALGYLIFGDVPGLWTIVGAGVVIMSGLYLLARERQVKFTRQRLR